MGRLAQMIMGFGRAVYSDAHTLVGQFDQSDPGGDRGVGLPTQPPPFIPLKLTPASVERRRLTHDVIL